MLEKSRIKHDIHLLPINKLEKMRTLCNYLGNLGRILGRIEKYAVNTEKFSKIANPQQINFGRSSTKIDSNQKFRKIISS